jgi:membrane protease YdiL (CAAX protease family)
MIFGLGLLPNPAKIAWSAFASGPLLMISTALAYHQLGRATPGGQLQRSDPAAPSLFQPLPSATGALGFALSHALFALGGSILIGVLMGALGVEVEEQARVLDVVHASQGTLTLDAAMLALAALVFAPITEELLFRYLFFGRLLHLDVADGRRRDPRSGVLSPSAFAWAAPACVFALIHFNVVGLVVYAWLGLVFADAYRRTGRIWVPMFVHFANNVVTLWLLFATAASAPPAL